MSNLTAATDQLVHTTNIEYDEFNRPVKATYPPAVAGGTRLLETVEYDAAGNVSKRTDTAGRVTTFAYDNANRLVTVTDPALKLTQYEHRRTFQWWTKRMVCISTWHARRARPVRTCS